MAEIPYPATANHFRCAKRSDIHPENILRKLAVLSARPSIKPTTPVRTPSTLARKRGRRFRIISDETSCRKLVAPVTHTFRGSERQPAVPPISTALSPANPPPSPLLDPIRPSLTSDWGQLLHFLGSIAFEYRP
jgi:hypothetical protein